MTASITAPSNSQFEANTLPLISNGYKAFNGQGTISRVLTEFSLKIPKGARLCLMGPNACGKSTLLHVLLGLEYLDSGDLYFEATADDLAAAVLQDYRRQLLPWASVSTNLLLPLSRSHRFSVTEGHLVSGALEFLARLGHRVSLEQKVGTLSGGQQQALVLARSFAFSPQLWILDEGMSAIDLARRSALSEMLVQHCAGKTALFVTHDLDDTLRLGTHLIVFDGGMNIAAEVSIDRDVDCTAAEFLVSSQAAAIRARVWTALGNTHSKS